jgi:hypothetical protein
VHYVAKPIYNLILCFICKKEINLGLIKFKVGDVLGIVKMYIDGCIGREFRGRTQGIEGSPYCLLMILDKIYIRVKFHSNNLLLKGLIVN